MNKPITNLFFLLLLTFYVLVLLLNFYNFYLPILIRNYYADLVAMPIILSVALTILRHLKNQQFLVLSGSKIIVGFIYLSVFFEFFLPQFSARYTRDYFDVLAYALGAFSFFCYQKICLTHETK